MSSFLSRLLEFVFKEFSSNLTKQFYEHFYRDYIEVIKSVSPHIKDHCQNHTPSYYCCHIAWRNWSLFDDLVDDLLKLEISSFALPKTVIQATHLFELCAIVLLRTHFSQKLQQLEPLVHGITVTQYLDVLAEVSNQRVQLENSLIYAQKHLPNRFLNQIVSANILDQDQLPLFEEVLEYLELGHGIVLDHSPSDKIKEIIEKVEQEFFQS